MSRRLFPVLLIAGILGISLSLFPASAQADFKPLPGTDPDYNDLAADFVPEGQQQRQSEFQTQQKTQTTQSGSDCVDLGVGITQGVDRGKDAGDAKEVCGQDGQGLIRNYILRIFNWGSVAIAALAVFMTIIGGYILMTSAGNPDRIKTGKSMISGSVIGILIVVFAYVILYVINPDIDTGLF